MVEIPTTSTTLLRDMANGSRHDRWNEFVARYRPMMEAFMCERFSSVEADDIIQETLVALCKVLPSYRYAPDEKGHFHNYLTGILRNKTMVALRKQRQQADLKEELQHVAGHPPEELSYRKSIFEIALRQFLADESIADRTKRIFERVAINGESPEAVADSFNMKRHAVDQAKSRAMDRLREIIKELEDIANG